MDPAVVSESSGVVKSRQFPGVYWTHDDSGNEAVLFAVSEFGELIAEVPVAASNVDWEDIAADDAGNLYIAETGNNLHWFKERRIYKLPEPDPFARATPKVTPTEVFTYTFSGERFDAEALFVRAGKVYLISKERERNAQIYRINKSAGGANTPIPIARLRSVRNASGADLSRDGGRLAVCTPNSLRVYAVHEDLAELESTVPLVVRYPRAKVEACCFDGDDVILTSESGYLYRITAEDLASGVIFTPPTQDSNRNDIRRTD